jgi:hypothetical protein
MSEQYLHYVKDESSITATGLLRCAVSVARDWLAPILSSKAVSLWEQ